MIRGMRSCTYRLNDTKAPRRMGEAGLPSTDYILKHLDGSGESVDEGANKDRGANAGRSIQADATPSANSGWIQEVLCRILADYMGPIAPVICRDTIESAGGVDTRDKIWLVVERLSTEIDDSAEAASFKARAKADLGNL